MVGHGQRGRAHSGATPTISKKKGVAHPPPTSRSPALLSIQIASPYKGGDTNDAASSNTPSSNHELSSLDTQGAVNVSFVPASSVGQDNLLALKIVELEDRPYVSSGVGCKVVPLPVDPILSSAKQTIYRFKDALFMKSEGRWTQLVRALTPDPHDSPSEDIHAMLQGGVIEPLKLGDAIIAGNLGGTPREVEENLLRYSNFYEGCRLEEIWEQPDSPDKRLALGIVATSIMRDAQLASLRSQLACIRKLPEGPDNEMAIILNGDDDHDDNCSVVSTPPDLKPYSSLHVEQSFTSNQPGSTNSLQATSSPPSSMSQTSLSVDPNKEGPIKEGATGFTPGAIHQSIECIKLRVVDFDSSELQFRVNINMPLEKLMKSYADRTGKNFAKLRFMFDARRCNSEDTPKSLEMEDGDVIEAYQALIA